MPKRNIRNIAIAGAILFIVLFGSAAAVFAQTTRGLYTDSTGTNIGIGTTTPQAALVVTNGNVGIGTWTADGGRLIVSGGNVGIGTTGPGTKLWVEGSNSTGYISTFYNTFNGAGGKAVRIINRENSASGTVLSLESGDISTATALVTVLGSGNVGIGTTSSTALLHLSGANPRAKLTATTGTNPSYWNIQNTGGTTYVGMESSVAGSEFIGTTAYASVFGSSGATDTHLITDTTARLTVKATSGNVGIGTTTTYGKLSVANTTGLINFLNLWATDANANGTVAGITFTTMSTQSRPRAAIYGISVPFEDVAGQGGELVFATRGAADGTTISTADEKMRINVNGYVGIGTTAPQRSLHVVSNYIRTDEATNPTILLRETTTNVEWGLRGRAARMEFMNHGTAEVFMSVTTAGNVGIGSTAPSGPLSVKTTGSPTSGVAGAFIIEDDGSNERCAIYIVGSNGQCTDNGGTILDTGSSSYTLCARCE